LMALLTAPALAMPTRRRNSAPKTRALGLAASSCRTRSCSGVRAETDFSNPFLSRLPALAEVVAAHNAAIFEWIVHTVPFPPSVSKARDVIPKRYYLLV
jgi:hypothetical protein